MENMAGDGLSERSRALYKECRFNTEGFEDPQGVFRPWGTSPDSRPPTPNLSGEPIQEPIQLPEDPPTNQAPSLLSFGTWVTPAPLPIRGHADIIFNEPTLPHPESVVRLHTIPEDGESTPAGYVHIRHEYPLRYNSYMRGCQQESLHPSLSHLVDISVGYTGNGPETGSYVPVMIPKKELFGEPALDAASEISRARGQIEGLIVSSHVQRGRSLQEAFKLAGLSYPGYLPKEAMHEALPKISSDSEIALTPALDADDLARLLAGPRNNIGDQSKGKSTGQSDRSPFSDISGMSDVSDPPSDIVAPPDLYIPEIDIPLQSTETPQVEYTSKRRAQFMSNTDTGTGPAQKIAKTSGTSESLESLKQNREIPEYSPFSTSDETSYQGLEEPRSLKGKHVSSKAVSSTSRGYQDGPFDVGQRAAVASESPFAFASKGGEVPLDVPELIMPPGKTGETVSGLPQPWGNVPISKTAGFPSKRTETAPDAPASISGPRETADINQSRSPTMSPFTPLRPNGQELLPVFETEQSETFTKDEASPRKKGKVNDTTKTPKKGTTKSKAKGKGRGGAESSSGSSARTPAPSDPGSRRSARVASKKQ